jgi:hypothetical protein
MATWDFDTPTQNTKIQSVDNYLTENLQSTTAGLNASRMLDLYNFLRSRTFSSPQQLQASVIKDGVPLFTPEEAKQVFDQLKMRGGGESVEFFDSMARRLAGYTGDWIPEYAKGYVYFLKGLEQNPDQGPLISTMLDVVAQGIPTLATTIQTMAPQIIGALPIPSAAVAGIVIGWIMSAFLLFFGMLVNLSRRKFGSAFVTSMALLPVVGSSLMNASKSLERVTGKISDRRDKLIRSVKSVFGPATGTSISEYIPDLQETPEAPVPPPSSLDSLKSRLPRIPSLSNMLTRNRM